MGRLHHRCGGLEQHVAGALPLNSLHGHLVAGDHDLAVSRLVAVGRLILTRLGERLACTRLTERETDGAICGRAAGRPGVND